MKITAKEFKTLLRDNNGNGNNLPDNLTVGGWLDLRNTAITSLPDNLTVGGWLDLSNTAITSLPDNLTVGGWLDLEGTAITSLPDNLTVGGWLDLEGTAITSLPDNLTVGGELDLRNTAITSLPDNLTVGGGLDLRNTAITSLPDNLTVGGWLDLEGTAITSLPDNLTVGGWLNLEGTAITSLQREKVKKPAKLGHNYIYVDGILMHVKQTKQVGEYTTYISPYNMVCVTKDKENYAHGKDIRTAILDLKFKMADRDKSDYESLTLKSVLEFDDAVIMFRIITGACQSGTAQFIENNNIEERAYTIQEIINITKDAYGGSMFSKFFKGGN